MHFKFGKASSGHWKVNIGLKTWITFDQKDDYGGGGVHRSEIDNRLKNENVSL